MTKEEQKAYTKYAKKVIKLYQNYVALSKGRGIPQAQAEKAWTDYVSNIKQLKNGFKLMYPSLF